MAAEINLGESKSNFQKVELTSILDTIEFIGTAAAQIIADEMDAKDVSSSGRLQDSVKALGAKQEGSKITNDIEALEYFDYEDEGVNGWDKQRGSRFSFRTKGVNPQGAMVKSVKEWLAREKSSATDKKKIRYSPSDRERKGSLITSLSVKKAVTVSYMIKRFGIKAKKFSQPAAQKIAEMAEKELGQAITVDIINNLTK